ncbi:xanthine dehydrogenase family protein subunit M [Streptomyces albiaxialis]|uniref:Xanthine dehydrogenase family protein subunit M n=1 Tax=Streptomyces albiaxialis TaxID=329523 RepID=A0ABN2VLX3_9ACTN
MKPAPFTYHRARDLDGATRLLAELADAGGEPKVVAGGQSLVAMMNFRLARPDHLVDISGLDGLRGIRPGVDGALRIGALTTHHEVETAPDLGPGFAVLRDAMRWVGHFPIRTRGTVGGSLAHADATAEWCLLALLLDAVLVAQGPGGVRRIDARDFFHGYYTTALEPDELLTEVVFPRPAPHAALTEYAQRHGDFATVAAAVDLDVAPDGRTVRGGRVALGGVAALPVRVPEAERVLAEGGPAGRDLFAACASAAATAIDPPNDANGSTDYRRGLTRTLVTRACEEAMPGA